MPDSYCECGAYVTRIDVLRDALDAETRRMRAVKAAWIALQDAYQDDAQADGKALIARLDYLLHVQREHPDDCNCVDHA